MIFKQQRRRLASEGVAVVLYGHAELVGSALSAGEALEILSRTLPADLGEALSSHGRDAAADLTIVLNGVAQIYSKRWQAIVDSGAEQEFMGPEIDARLQQACQSAARDLQVLADGLPAQSGG